MINRALIRIKTVQLLYSYMLVEKPFLLESQPSQPTKEKRFAYNLYLDIIYLIYRIAGKVVSHKSKFPLKESRFIKKLEGLEIIKSLEVKYKTGDFPYANVEKEIAGKISDSLLYREYINDPEKAQTVEHFWENVYKAIIFPDQSLNDLIKNQPDYSLSGIDRMNEMMLTTFKNFYINGEGLPEALNSLQKSMQKSRELYMRLLALPIDLTRLRLDQIELNRKKYLATQEDLNPNMKFVDNKLVRILEENTELNGYLETNKISWLGEERELLERILRRIIDSDIFNNYILSNVNSLDADIDLWRDLFRDEILNDEDFLEYLENKSVFWNDDLEIISTFIIKTFKKLGSDNEADRTLLPMYKDEEDARFGADLFKYVVTGKEEYQKMIEKALTGDKWEADRLAFMDVVIVMTALAEIINYPKIPLSASINEYIEIAKSYSSEKSGAFVHGVLGKIVGVLRAEGKLYK